MGEGEAKRRRRLDQRAAVALVFYGILSAVALLWGWLASRPRLDRMEAPWLRLPFEQALGLSLGLGLLLALLTIASTRLVIPRFGWARKMHSEFRSILGDLGPGTALVYALSSGIGEELFFRGAMQPSLGWALSSLIFGLVHFAGRRLWPWTVWAIGMGFLFGAIFEATGQLAGCVLAHALINYVNLRFIAEYDPDPQLSAEFYAQRRPAAESTSSGESPLG